MCVCLCVQQKQMMCSGRKVGFMTFRWNFTQRFSASHYVKKAAPRPGHLKEPQHSPTQSYKSASRTEAYCCCERAHETNTSHSKGRAGWPKHRYIIHSAQQSRQNRRAHSFCTATYFCSSKQQWHAAGSSSTKGRRRHP